jgi:hypothetical protein
MNQPTELIFNKLVKYLLYIAFYSKEINIQIYQNGLELSDRYESGVIPRWNGLLGPSYAVKTTDILHFRITPQNGVDPVDCCWVESCNMDSCMDWFINSCDRYRAKTPCRSVQIQQTNTCFYRIRCDLFEEGSLYSIYYW